MTTTHDTVTASVEAYTDHVVAYQAHNAGRMGELVERFLAGLEPADDVILDAGCGPGRDLSRFSSAGHCTVGVDLNEAFLAAAEAATDGYPVRLERADLRNLPFADDSFAGTWACASLVHLDPDGAAVALRELARVTRPGGPVYVSVKVAGTTGWADTDHGRRWFHRWDPDVFADLARTAGLTVEDISVGEVFVDVWARA